MTAGYFGYWGEARRVSGRDGPDYHLLVFHCLDVVAVGRSLLDPRKPLCRSLAEQLEAKPDWLQAWFAFCLILHDIGKFCRAFQNLAPDLSECLVPNCTQCTYDKRHTR